MGLHTYGYVCVRVFVCIRVCKYSRVGRVHVCVRVCSGVMYVCTRMCEEGFRNDHRSSTSGAPVHKSFLLRSGKSKICETKTQFVPLLLVNDTRRDTVRDIVPGYIE